METAPPGGPHVDNLPITRDRRSVQVVARRQAAGELDLTPTVTQACGPASGLKEPGSLQPLRLALAAA